MMEVKRVVGETRHISIRQKEGNDSFDYAVLYNTPDVAGILV